MTRPVDRLFMGTTGFNYDGHPVLNAEYGGQFAYGTELREWESNANYVRRNSIILMLNAPQFFKLLPDGDIMTRYLKSLIENHARRIEGFNRELTVEVGETAFGGGGEFQQEYLDVKRARTEPQITWDEKYGMTVGNFLEWWIQTGMMDPNSKYANIATINGINKPKDWLPDQYSMSIIAIEPDPTHQFVNQAFLTTNMWPHGTGPMEAKRSMADANELVERSIKFSGITQVGAGVNALAKKLLDEINITNANPSLQPAFLSGISPDVASAPVGYKNRAETLGATAFRRP